VVAEALRIVDIEVARSVTLACADAKDRGILPYLPQLKARAGGLFDVLEHNVRRDFSWLPRLIAGPLLGWLLILILKWLVAKWKA
jgi:hypothetical protein